MLAPLAEARGTALWVENMPFAFLPMADEMMEAIERHGDPRLGVVYDIANGVFAREDLAHGLQRVRGRLKLVHLSDTPLAVYRHAPVGTGVVPFAAVPPVLEQIGYEGLPMLLLPPHPRQILLDARAPIDAICDQAERVRASRRLWHRAPGAASGGPRTGRPPPEDVHVALPAVRSRASSAPEDWGDADVLRVRAPDALPGLLRLFEVT